MSRNNSIPPRKILNIIFKISTEYYFKKKKKKATYKKKKKKATFSWPTTYTSIV